MKLLEDVREMQPSGGDEREAREWTIRQLGTLYLDDYNRPDLAIECLKEFQDSEKSGARTLYDLGRAYEAKGDAGAADPVLPAGGGLRGQPGPVGRRGGHPPADRPRGPERVGDGMPSGVDRGAVAHVMSPRPRPQEPPRVPHPPSAALRTVPRPAAAARRLQRPRRGQLRPALPARHRRHPRPLRSWTGTTPRSPRSPSTRRHNRTGDHWHVRVARAAADAFCYGYRVDGPDRRRAPVRPDHRPARPGLGHCCPTGPSGGRRVRDRPAPHQPPQPVLPRAAVRLGATTHPPLIPLEDIDHLRAARPRLHLPPVRRPCRPRHVRRPDREDPLPQGARASPPSSCCRSTSSTRTTARSSTR